ncbi:GNAT family N-acetyltransferase [Niveibacterium terrae]|uniref:GNAT family N-acetyltransferase n=1 Tax=Niveibacterium terrae TaxID=3373598 RepID=UPI003A8C9634
MASPVSSSPSPVFHIRSADAADLPAITHCTLSAFTLFDVFGPAWNSDSGLLPARLSALPESHGFVAVDEKNSVIGHAQWTHVAMHLLGGTRRAACLAPLSVRADRQRQGIGGALIRQGIAALREAGIDLLFLLGHEAYYPRFGLQCGCLGRHALSIAMPEALAADPEGYRLRPLHDGDEFALRALWHRLCGGVDGALEPGPGLLPWSSATRGIIACVLERGGQIVGHARFDARAEAMADSGVLRFLAADAASAGVLASRIAGWTGWQAKSLTLPLPAGSAHVQELFAGREPEPVFERWAPGMAMALQQNETETLLARIQAGEAPPLFIEWPSLFDY